MAAEQSVQRPLRLLFLSWRDPDNPKAGGAELFTHEIARRLVAHGDQVEWFTASFPGSAPEVDMNGVHVVRAGRQWSVHAAAVRKYRGHLAGEFDAVIDEVNTVPFFTPLWAGIPSLMLIFQLAREVWWYESRFPVSTIGYASEPLYLRAYRRTPVLTISGSTRNDLRALGFRAPIRILPIGLEPISARELAKSGSATFLYVGRMAQSKRVHDVVRAFALYRKQTGEGDLWLVGDGSPAYVDELRRLATHLQLDSHVEFCGRLSNEAKHERMARAHVLLMASAREGWGLSIAEANSLGTPAVVYDVAGLRDAVRDGETGFVVPASPEHLAQGMVRLLGDADLYRRFVAEGRRWSATFSFQRAAEETRAAVVETIAGWAHDTGRSSGELGR